MRIESKRAGQRERHEWLVLLASFSLAGITLVGLQFFGVQLCLLHRYAGVPCPLCGSSRTLLLLLKGRIVDAFLLQPLGVLAMIGLGLWLLICSCFIFFYGKVISLTISARERSYMLWAAAILIAANWAYLLLGGVL